MLPIGNQSRTPIYPTSRTRRGASERAVLEPGEIDVLREVLPEFPGQRNVTDTILELPQIRDVRDAIQRAPVQPPDGYISKVLKICPGGDHCSIHRNHGGHSRSSRIRTESADGHEGHICLVFDCYSSLFLDEFAKTTRG
jgi:hypothetical protein